MLWAGGLGESTSLAICAIDRVWVENIHRVDGFGRSSL